MKYLFITVAIAIFAIVLVAHASCIPFAGDICFDEATGKLVNSNTQTPLTGATSSSSSALPAIYTLDANASTSANTTPVSLTGLVFTYEANSTYSIEITGRVQSGAATTGIGLQFDVSTAVTSINSTFYHQLANTGTLTSGHSIADNASVGVSSGVPALVPIPVTGKAFIVTGAATGTAQLMLRSETTAITGAVAGFKMIVSKIQ